MFIFGLTGSIGMGKTTAASLLRRLGLPVHDADATVHRLLAPGGRAVAAIDAAFPGVVKDGGVDRQELGRRVFGNDPALKRLEAIVHPLVRAEERRFLSIMARRRVRRVVLDIPLLFESGGTARCDAVLVVSAPAFLQRHRVLRRPGMTEEKFAAILARQLPDPIKRRRADGIIPSGRGRAVTWRALRSLLADWADQRGRAWPPTGPIPRSASRKRPNSPSLLPPRSR